ncbi:NAD(P)H-binding protein [Saccharothrix mutabilis subsp. mutabilis]|uniref:NAD(P)H-binding protein n=1 Tax=Saccharothrix mutabilis subsp. mutabilis TaxID=66855 RepID=A0ABN0UQU9_9PSEU
MIVVTGATGNVGRPLVETLAAAGEEVVAVSRGTGVTGVPHRRADLTDPASLAPALVGASAVFLLTSPDYLGSGAAFGDVVDVVRAAGVRRVVLLSSQGVATGRHPDGIEQAVRSSGLEWTVLQPGAFASNAFQWAQPISTSRTAAAPFGDVALPVVHTSDIADVAAAVLRSESHAGRSYVLTGPAAITPRQQVAAIGEALGEPVEFVELSRAEAKAGMLRHMPEPVVETTLDLLGTPTPLEQSVNPDVESVLDRPARPFTDWVRRNVVAFK